jgi:CubicO group peptidase (beta-lactamase class C family)
MAVRSPVPAEVTHVADTLFAREAVHGCSLALLVRHRGEVVFERYGTQPDTVFGPGSAVGPDTTLISWSMAKSITQACVGMAVGDGLLDIDVPAPVPSWQGTEKESISLRHLLEMTPGLLFVEDYVDDSVSHCIEMLYGSGQNDMAAYAAGLPLIHPPGSVWNYSSGTTNIVSAIVGDAIGGVGDQRKASMVAFLRDRLFGPLGMTSATAGFDSAGTFVGSSYVYATAADFSRFGQLYLDDGVVAGRRILPPGWRDLARTQIAFDDDTGFGYGHQWWLWPAFPGSMGCHGYEGQYIVVVPDRDLVVVHLGKSPIERRGPLIAALTAVIDAFAP